jgi:hypothetical protein
MLIFVLLKIIMYTLEDSSHQHPEEYPFFLSFLGTQKTFLSSLWQYVKQFD